LSTTARCSCGMSVFRDYWDRRRWNELKSFGLLLCQAKQTNTTCTSPTSLYHKQFQYLIYHFAVRVRWPDLTRLLLYLQRALTLVRMTFAPALAGFLPSLHCSYPYSTVPTLTPSFLPSVMRPFLDQIYASFLPHH
jgi:hypothetical protein